ncbi:hypothetical protein JXA12_01330 [Candidatus Woesearchaeota archaeon]|nr:hypothetical protein [Candidatus Woesearchaeota archaeon]
MRNTPLSILLAFIILALLTGCGEDQAGINETNETAAPPVAANETTPEETALPKEQKEEEPLPAPVSIDTLLLELRNLILYQVAYGDDEVYELRMIMSAEQHGSLEAATLAFNPECDEDVRMLITVNDKLVHNGDMDCYEDMSFPIDTGLFLEGQNVIALHAKVDKIFVLTDTILTLSYDDGTSEPLPAEDFFFRASDDKDERALRTLDSVLLTNTIERTFTLDEEDVAEDLYLELEAREQEGELVILLNGHQVYAGEPSRRGERVELPLELLEVGKNTLAFIGIAD